MTTRRNFLHTIAAACAGLPLMGWLGRGAGAEPVDIGEGWTAYVRTDRDGVLRLPGGQGYWPLWDADGDPIYARLARDCTVAMWVWDDGREMPGVCAIKVTKHFHCSPSSRRNTATTSSTGRTKGNA